jgi:type II secretory ATPase GspE/PulE/Tfp pilus assembly ATPase PilB-like protein
MVGEIRDLETAEIAIKAAQTGHMVLVDLHTNDAPGTLTRLMNMGIPTFNIASSILLITAQRLVRRLCTCKKPLETPVETLLNAGFTEAIWMAPGRSTVRAVANAARGSPATRDASALSGDAGHRRDFAHHSGWWQRT